MSKSRVAGIALAALLLPLSATAAGQAPEPPLATAAKPSAQDAAPSLADLAKSAARAKRDGDYDALIAGLQQMRRLDPYDGRITYGLAEAYALKNDPEHAFAMLARLQQQGLAYDPRGDTDFDNVKKYQLFDYLGENLAKNSEPFNQATRAFETDKPLGLPDGIALDPESGAFFLAGLKQGLILRVGADGKSEEFYRAGDDGPRGITALAVDPDNGVLWAAGTEVRLQGDEQVSVNARAAALYAFDLKTGKLEARHAIDEQARELPHLISEMAVAPDGAVYVTDRLSPVIYVLKPGAAKLEPFLGSPKLSSLQGLAIDDKGEYLYVADWMTGIYRIHLQSQHVQPLAIDPSVNLGGIRSLAYRDGELFAVQTGTRPERVVRYELSDDGDAVVGQQPLSANQPEYDHPGAGVMGKDGFYFIANTGWGRINQPPSQTGAVPVVVLKANPDLAREKAQPANIMQKAAPGAVPGRVENLPPGIPQQGSGKPEDSGDDNG